MNVKTCRVLFLVLLLGLISSCAGHPRVIVVFDRPEGLKSGDRVIWENQVIGSVGALETNPKGRTSVPLYIKKDFRSVVTDRSRFVIEADPSEPGNQSVKMIPLSSGGNPLPDGAAVEGSTSFSILMEKGSSSAQGWSELFLEAIDRLGKEVRRLSEEEWQRELERQLDEWARELERSGTEVRRYFQKEILPQLEQAVRDLLRRLKELGKEKESQPLEEKFDHLRRTLDSRR